MIDPVTAYAEAVCDGRVIAAKLVRQACRRHLTDLARQAETGLEWRPVEAQRVIEFFSEVLCLPDEGNPESGKRFVLSPFQQFIAGSLFGWYVAATGNRRFRTAYVETAKGSGKTPFGAGLMLYLLVADGERGAQVYTAAVTKEQAKLAFTDAENMVDASPHLKALIDKKVNNLAILETGSFMRPISSEKRGLDGKRVHGCLIDELHEHATPIVTSKMSAGTKNRLNALILEITNSGFDRETVCWEHHEYSRQVLEGTIANDAWFAFVCHLDACAKCAEGGHYQPSDDCADCDDWKTEGPHWLKANPNLGVSLQWTYLKEQVRKAVDIPSERNMVRRLNFCQWTQQDTVWIPVEKWADCKTTLLPAALIGRACYVGIDLSDKIDLSSVVLAFPRELEHVVNGDVKLDQALDVLPFFFMPKKSIVKRGEEDRIPYADWAAQDHIKTTHASTVDHDAIVDFIVGDLAKKYSIQAIGIDASGAAAVVTRLQRHFGDEKVIEIPQSFRQLSEPSKTLEALVVSGNLAHPGNPCLDWNVANMAIEENTWREIRPIKIDQRKRIDGGVALIEAIKAMQLIPFAHNVYMRRGVRTLGA